jgi:hypothetical protein
LRLVQEGEGEDSMLKIYYSTENTREYHEAEEQWLEVLEVFKIFFPRQCCGSGSEYRSGSISTRNFLQDPDP